jgi:hypothetical protein
LVVRGILPSLLWFTMFYVTSTLTDASAQCGIHSCFTTGMSASIVIGQPDFTSREPNQGLRELGTTANSLWQPIGLAFDLSGNLWVGDGVNNRVLRYTSPFTTGMPASLVLGQPDFTSREPNQGLRTEDFLLQTASTLHTPRDVSFDSSGNLWVSDTGNDRVLRYTPPFTNGMPASLVLGQSVFTSATSPRPPTASSLRSPSFLDFDSTGNLWVGDTGNLRVLRYSPPFTNGMPASLVLGQPDFTSVTEHDPPTASSLRAAMDVTFDGLNLWVADGINNRVLMYSPPFTNGMSASLVFGQTDFTSGRGNQGLWSRGATASSLHGPWALDFDLQGGLWVADSNNHRVLEYFTSGLITDFLGNGQEASVVLGQTDFTRNKINAGGFPSASSLGFPTDVTFDSSGNLWEVDSANSRILKFVAPAPQ